MQNTRETIRALIRAFNVNNYDFNVVETNFGLQSGKKKDYIIVSFDKDMNEYQCREYLDKIKRKIISEFYDVEKDIGEELNTAKLIFDVESFPFNISKGKLSQEQGGIKLVVPIDEGVIFNLKSHLASSLKKDVLEDMPTCSIFTNAFNKKKYLWHGKFPSARSSKQFRNMFLSRMKERYENAPDEDKFLKVEGNDVYIRDVFDNACFIDSIVRYTACAIGIDLGTDNNVDYRVMLLKDSIIKSIYQSTGVMVAGFMCASPFGRKEASILIPVVQGYEGCRLLTKQEARAINCAFRGVVLNDLYGRTQAELSIRGNSGIYSIDFSNPQISHCVINKIIENSVINNDYRLTVDFELPFQSWSRSPSTELDSPRHEQGLLHHTIDSSQSQQSIGAAAIGADKSVQEADIWLQQKNPWLSQDTHEDKWLQSLAVDADESSHSGKFSKAKSEEDRVSSKSGSGSPKKHEALQSESSSSKCADELEQGASGGFSASSESGGKYEEDRAKSESPKRHGVLCKLKSFLFSKSDQPDENFERHDVRRSSTQSAPVPRVSKKPPVSKQRSFPGRRKARSNPPSEVSSPAHLKNTSWQLPEVIVESTLPVEDKSRLLKPEVPIHRNDFQKSKDSGVGSLEPSPRTSLNVATFAKSKPNGAGDEELSSFLPELNNTPEPSVKSKPFSLPRASLINEAPTSSSTQKLPTQSGEHVVTPVYGLPHVPLILRSKYDQESKSQEFSVHTPLSALWGGVAGSSKSNPPGKLSSLKVEEQKQQVPRQKSV